MTLIKCSECGKEISDKAESCPHCGNPIQLNVVSVDGAVEIERTNKKWKKQRLWGLAILFFGFMFLSKSIGWGIFIIFVGFFTIIASRIGGWWTNG